MSVADNFDYSIPFIAKGNTMYLSTINQNDAIIRPFKKMYTKRDWSANLYNLDIESSMPRRFGVFTNKVDFINKVDDIERTNPKILHYPLNRPEFNLTNKDIEKSSPKMEHLNTRRCTNPLEPKYTLPKVEEYPPPSPKFIRDSIDIKDIAGARPQKYFQWKTRETFPKNNYGIEGSKSKQAYVRKNLGSIKYHYIDYNDLTRDIFKTKRKTNPLDPIYHFKKNEEIFKYGPIEKSKPQTQYPYFYQPSLNLKLDDIKGANIGSKNRINKFTGNNYELTTKDIKGCKAGSLKKGIVTKRCTNPLNPNYQYLGEKQLQGSKFGEYSEKGQFSNNNNGNKNIPVEDKKQNEQIIDKAGSVNITNTNPKMKKVNVVNKAVNNNINIPEERKDIIDNNQIDPNFEECNSNANTINFDREVFGKKPDPNFGFYHDPHVQSSENLERLQEIEKAKKMKFAMSKTTNNGFFKSKNNDNIIAKYKNNPNLYNFNKYQNISGNKIYGGVQETNLGSAGQLNLEEGNQGEKNEMDELKRMNRTSIGFRPMKKTYEEKLDQFMEANSMKAFKQGNSKINTNNNTSKNKIEPEQINTLNKGKKN